MKKLFEADHKALRYILNHLKKSTPVGEAPVRDILNTYKSICTDNKEDGEKFLKDHVKNASDNLEAKLIFEKIVSGEKDLSFLMAKCKPLEKEDIRQELEILKGLAAEMYKDTTTPFNRTRQYHEMKTIASTALHANEGHFRYLKEVAELENNTPKPSTIKELARYIGLNSVVTIQNKIQLKENKIKVISLVAQSLRSLLYLETIESPGKRQEIKNETENVLNFYSSMLPKEGYKNILLQINHLKKEYTSK